MLRTGHVDQFARDHLPSHELQPDFLFTRPELQYPERLNATAELLDRTVADGHGERIVLRHLATDRAIFARGALRAALWGQDRKPGEYDMIDVLGL